MSTEKTRHWMANSISLKGSSCVYIVHSYKHLDVNTWGAWLLFQSLSFLFSSWFVSIEFSLVHLVPILLNFNEFVVQGLIPTCDILDWFSVSSVQLMNRAAGGGEFLFDLLFISEPIYCVKYEQYPSSIRSRSRFCSEFPYMARNCFLLFFSCCCYCYHYHCQF